MVGEGNSCPSQRDGNGDRISYSLDSGCERNAHYRLRSRAEAGDYKRRDPKKSLALFRAVRESNVDVLKSLKAAEWKQHGMHSERGPESLEVIASMIAGHDVNHILQIEAILGDRGNSRKKPARK